MKAFMRLYAVSSDGYLAHVATIDEWLDRERILDIIDTYEVEQGVPLSYVYTVEEPDSDVQQSGVIHTFHKD